MYLEMAGRAQVARGQAGRSRKRCASGDSSRGGVAEKGMAAMFEDDDDARVESARMLAEGGSQPAAAEAFRSIAVDEGVGEDVRLEAARGLAELDEIDERAAVAAYRSIAVDEGVGEDVRLEAARGLAEIDERAAAEACCSIAVDEGVGEDVRLEAAMLAGGDRRYAAQAFRSIAVDEGVGEDVRLEAARGLAEISKRTAGVP
jgi:hypothetical protein